MIRTRNICSTIMFSYSNHGPTMNCAFRQAPHVHTHRNRKNRHKIPHTLPSLPLFLFIDRAQNRRISPASRPIPQSVQGNTRSGRTVEPPITAASRAVRRDTMAVHPDRFPRTPSSVTMIGECVDEPTRCTTSYK